MTLISCSECKASISDQASACPHCGCPISKPPITAYADEQSIDSSSRNRGKNGGHAWAWVIRIAICIPIILIAGIYVRNKAVGPVGWAQDNTEKELKDRMKDPSSMVIRLLYAVQKADAKGNESIYICGIVDGKNSFGSYAGGTRFASWSTYSKSLETLNTISLQMENPEEQRAAEKIGWLSGFDKIYWNEWCVDANHPAVVIQKDS